MAIEEKNAIELIDSVTVTSGDTSANLSGMDDRGTYLLIFNNLVDTDDAGSLYMNLTYNDNDQVLRTVTHFAGRQLVNGTNSNQSVKSTFNRLQNYGNTGSSYITNGYAYLYQLEDSTEQKQNRFSYQGNVVSYNDTNLVSHDIYAQDSYYQFSVNGIKLFPSSGAWESGEFKLYKLRIAS